MTATLEHQRQKAFLEDVIDDLLIPKGSVPICPETILIVTGSYQESEYHIRQLIEVIQLHKLFTANKVDIFRGAVRVFNYDRKWTTISFCTFQRLESLHGMKPDEIIFTGSLGEFMMLALSTGAKLKATG